MVDERLQGLRRQLKLEPGSAETARRYDHARRRAGQGDEVDLQLIEKYVCVRTWEELERVPDEEGRRCPTCDARVPPGRGEALTVERVTSGAPYVLYPALAQVETLLAGVRGLHTGFESRPGRAHLMREGTPRGGIAVLMSRPYDDLFDEHRVWLLPVITGAHETDALARAIQLLLPVARRVTPPGYAPYLLLHDHPKRPLPESPIEHVLGWLVGPGLLTRTGDGLGLPSLNEMRSLLDERARALGALPPPSVRVTCVATPAFRSSLPRLKASIDPLCLSGFELEVAPQPLELPGRGPLAARDVLGALEQHPAEGLRMVFVERPHVDGWFARHDGAAAVIFLDRFARKTLRTPTLAIARHLLAKKVLDLLARAPLAMHEEPRGCVFDLCRDKAQLDARIAEGRLCTWCRSQLLWEQGVPTAVVEVMQRLLQATAEEL